MKAEAGVSWPERTLPQEGTFWNRLLHLIRRTPNRLRERRFWYVQALVIVATAPHYAIESSGELFPTLESWQLNSLAITLYILPLLYAALNYRWEGALLTGVWAGLLTSPSIWFWGRAETHWATELAQLMVVLPVGVLVAWRVDLEAKQRRRAEETSASLALLNRIGESLRHTLEVEQQLPQVLRRLLSGLSLNSAWLCLEPETEGEPVTMVEGSPQQPPTTAIAQDLHRRLTSQDEPLVGPVLMDNKAVAVALMGETGMVGSLGVTTGEGKTLTAEQVELLTTVAQQVRVAVENARLYRQRQESLRSYAQQVTQGQEEERLRIARELHDETAQELVHLVRKLEQLRDGPASDLKQPVDELLDQTRGTLQSVRRFSRDLRPSVLDDLGLVAAIEMVVEETNSSLPQGAQLQVTGKPRRVDQPVELALFRIAQESLRNVEKHADARSATVALDFGVEEINLSVTDDGHGFSSVPNISDLPQAGKLGLLGMKERAELVGGSFNVHSHPGEGTRLVVRVTPGGKPG